MTAMRFAVLFSVLWACVLSSCATVSPVSPQEKRLFALDPKRPAGEPSRQAKPGVLQVRRLSVSPGFADRMLIYRTAEGQYVPDPYNTYLTAPSDMITQAATTWLRNAGVFEHTVTSSSRLRPNFVLEGTVPELYADFSAGKAHVGLACILLRDDSLSYEVLLTTEYAVETVLPSLDAKGAVAGLEAGLADIFAQLERDMANLTTALETQ